MTAPDGCHQLLGSHFEGMRFAFRFAKPLLTNLSRQMPRQIRQSCRFCIKDFDFRETTRKVVSPFQASRM